jgi:hypothetical protein
VLGQHDRVHRTGRIEDGPKILHPGLERGEL